MKVDRTTIRKAVWSGVESGLFFLLFFLYVWLVVDPRLIDHRIGLLAYYQPFVFHSGWPFLAAHLSHAGGLVEYAAGLLLQTYSFGWPGALILTAGAWSASLGVDAVCRRSGRPRGHILRYVPAAILLMIFGGYSHPLNAVLSLLVAIAAYVSCRPRRAGNSRATAVLVRDCVLRVLLGVRREACSFPS